jgi:hypothetical protein
MKPSPLHSLPQVPRGCPQRPTSEAWANANPPEASRTLTMVRMDFVFIVLVFYQFWFLAVDGIARPSIDKTPAT